MRQRWGELRERGRKGLMIRCIVRGPLKLVEKAEEAEIHDGLSIWKWELAVGPKLAPCFLANCCAYPLVHPFNQYRESGISRLFAYSIRHS